MRSKLCTQSETMPSSSCTQQTRPSNNWQLGLEALFLLPAHSTLESMLLGFILVA